jgi:hypothetical protein
MSGWVVESCIKRVVEMKKRKQVQEAEWVWENSFVDFARRVFGVDGYA